MSLNDVLTAKTPMPTQEGGLWVVFYKVKSDPCSNIHVVCNIHLH